jgi:hypothetical protein
MRTSYRFAIFLLFLFANAQLLGQAISDTTKHISYEAFFQQLEKQEKVNIYYKSEWFAGKKISASILTFRLEDALAAVKRLCNLDYIDMDKGTIVFVPAIQMNFHFTSGNNDALAVGTPSGNDRLAEANLSGKIVDGKNNESLPSVIIQDEKTKKFAVTDAKGNFSLTLPLGEHTFNISYIGFQNSRRTINLLGNGKVEFAIFEKSLQLNEVVITEERGDYNVSRTQMSVVKMDARLIKELPISLGETDIIKSVSLLPGIQSVGEFGSGFNVRGGSADQNLIMIEDVPLFNSSHLFGLNSVINPDGVSGLTLYKTGIPARYGERVSSVMLIKLGNATTDKPTLKGGIGLLNSRLSLETPLFHKKASLLIGGRSSYSDWLLHKMPDIDLMNSSASFYDLNTLLQININQNNRVSIFGYYSSDRFSFSKTTHYQYNNILSSIRWNHSFGYKLSSGLVIGMSKYIFDVKEKDKLYLQEANQIKFGTDYYSLKWNFNYLPNENHNIDAGINGVLYNIRPGEMLPLGDSSTVEQQKMQLEKGLEMSAYLSDDFKITSRLSAEVGLRYVQYLSLGQGDVLVFASGLPHTLENIIDTLHYKNNQTIKRFQAFEPRVSARYSLNESSSVKLSYTRMNQFINLISNTSVMSPTDTWKLSGANSKPLICDQFSLGYFRNFSENTIITSVEVYYKNLTNIIEYKNGAQVLLNSHLETDLLDAKAYSTGIEFYIKKNSGKLNGWISYTFSQSKHKTTSSYTEEQLNNNRYFVSNYDVPQNLIVNVNYHLSRRWRLAGTFTHNTGRPVTLPEIKYDINGNQLIWYSDRNKYRLPDYHRLDLSITLDPSLKIKKKWKGSWTLSVINVYGRKNAYSVFYSREDPRIWNGNGSYNLYKSYIIGIPLPTITYNFSF